MANGALTGGQRIGFAGEEVDLAVDYEPVQTPKEVIFEVHTVPDAALVHSQRVQTQSSPARLRWSILHPLDRQLPFEMRFQARFPDSSTVLSSAVMEVHPPPHMSIWASYAMSRSAVQPIQSLMDLTLDKWGIPTLDDISSLTGIQADGDPARVVEDPRVPGGEPNAAARRVRLREVIDAAHAKGIKLLAGYEAVRKGSTRSVQADRFMGFVRRACTRQGGNETLVKNQYGEDEVVPLNDVIDAHVSAIVDYLFANPSTSLDWDGVGFDIEIGELHPRYRPVLRELYQRLARRIAPKIVTFATFGFTGRQTGRGGKPVFWPFQRAQTFDLCTGVDNLIARTMLYEEQVDEPFLKAIVDYAFRPVSQGGAGLKRHQLQQGFQGDPQPRQAPRRGITPTAQVEGFIRNVLRPEACGLIFFMLFNSAKVDRCRMADFHMLHAAYWKRL